VPFLPLELPESPVYISRFMNGVWFRALK